MPIDHPIGPQVCTCHTWNWSTNPQTYPTEPYHTNHSMVVFPTVEDTISKPTSKIRITFNRRLTYAERETFYWGVTKDQELDVKWTNDGLVAWIEDRATYSYGGDEADVGSRSIHQIVADFVEMNYVNVHPVATKTLIPEVKI